MAEENPKPLTVPYIYARAAEIEGRHPEDAGAWGITSCRMQFGEGIPDTDDPLNTLVVPPDGLLPSVPVIPALRLRREILAGYRRPLTSRSVVQFLNAHPLQGVIISLPLSSGWIKPDNGMIIMPQPDDVYYANTHLVTMFGVTDSETHFVFQNSWGEEWGDRGFGYLPCEYLDEYAFESYIFELTTNTNYESDNEGHVPLTIAKAPVHLRRQVTRTEENDRHYGFIVEKSRFERYAWAFIREGHASLDVEEVFVRHEYRRQGCENILLDAIKKLRKIKGLPIRIFVPWPESKRESPESYQAICDFAAALNCTFVDCRDRRAAYMAIEGDSGSYEPIVPNPYPERPTGPMFELMFAAAMAIITAKSPQGIDETPEISKRRIPYSETDLQRIKDALNELNIYKYQLIDKKGRGGLSVNEEKKLAAYQEKAHLLGAQVAPLDTSNSETSGVYDSNPAAHIKWTEELNARRCRLIDKKLQAQLTDAEAGELERLQRAMRHHVNEVAPLPIEAAQRLYATLLQKRQAKP